MAEAIDMIKTITTDFEEGQIFTGTVVSIKEFGAFIEFAPGKEGMVHISKISKERINRVEDVLTLGDKVKVFSDLGKDDRREYEGTITWISDKSEFTPKTIQTRDERANLVYATKIAVKNDGYIKIGMYGEMKK
mgnify:FL=1